MYAENENPSGFSEKGEDHCKRQNQTGKGLSQSSPFFKNAKNEEKTIKIRHHPPQRHEKDKSIITIFIESIEV